MLVKTRIHNVEYDLTDFYLKHPGGTQSIKLAAGRDSTVLFESHHPFTSPARLARILERYRVPPSTASNSNSNSCSDTLLQKELYSPDPFDWPTSHFANDVKSEVYAYFTHHAQRRGIPIIQAIKATPAKWVEIFVLFAIYLAAVTYTVMYPEPWMLIGLPVAAWFSGISLFHDASHWSVSHRPWLNVVLVYLWPFFSSPFTWAHQHIIGHHVYTNISSKDPDLLHETELRREHPENEWTEVHVGQTKWWRLLIHWSLATWAGLGLRNDFLLFWTSSYNGVVPIIPVSKARIFTHFLAKGAFYTIILTWPFWSGTFESSSYPAITTQFWYKLLFALVPSILFSWMFMLNTQLNHLSTPATSTSSRDWYKHQVLTSQNFGNGNALVHMFSGGLGYQIEHHLFPTVNSCHYPDLGVIVKRVCERHGVSYQSSSGYWESLVLYYQHTVNMSMPEGVDEGIELKDEKVVKVIDQKSQ